MPPSSHAAPPRATPPTSDAPRAFVAAAHAPRARAFGTAVAYGRVARATRASPHTLARLMRTVPAPDEDARRANVWAALGAYFGWRGEAPIAAASRDYDV